MAARRTAAANRAAASSSEKYSGTAGVRGEEDPKDKDMQAPVKGPFAHFCGIHMAKKDPKFQIITQHYCVAHSEHHGDDLFQCLLFDSTEKTASSSGSSTSSATR